MHPQHVVRIDLSHRGGGDPMIQVLPQRVNERRFADTQPPSDHQAARAPELLQHNREDQKARGEPLAAVSQAHDAKRIAARQPASRARPRLIDICPSLRQVADGILA